MKNTQILVRLLAVILAVSAAVSCFSACAQTGQEDASDTEATGTEAETSSWVKDGVPDKNYGGRSFNILSQNLIDAGPKDLEDMKNSDALCQAVWERNRYVENRLGINISVEEEGYEGMKSVAIRCFTSGDMSYDLLFMHMVSGTDLASGGYLYNLNRLESIDKTAPWWDRDVGNGFEVGGALYMTAGDIVPFTLLTTGCMAFNKELFDRRGLTYPYEAAEKGEWTVDSLSALTADVTFDLDGDGSITPDKDFYGLAAHNLGAPFNFFFGSGCSMIARDEDGLPEYAADTAKIEAAYEQLYNLIYNQKALYVMVDNGDDFFLGYRAFTDSRALFVSTYLHEIYSAPYGFKDMKDEYGVLPQPKYDQNQKEYLSFVNGSASMVCVINLIHDDETEDYVGNVIEALGNASYNLVTYTLYEVTAKAKNVNDPQSAKMVDIIIRNRVFDFAYAHFFGQGLACSTLFRDALNAKNPTVSGRMKQVERSTKTALRDMLNAYRKNA